MTRSIPAEMDATVVAEIDARLDAIARDEPVTLGLAIESGSRAWGFPSPDSDYDCRFVFIRPRQHYLSLFAKRDVIETPMTGILDVNGWDLAKALRLLLNGNAVVVEWLMSPIVYRADTAFAGEFLDLARAVSNRDRMAQHYLHLARRAMEGQLDNPSDVALKKILYALRPALALERMRANPDEPIVPMNIRALMEGCRLSAALLDSIEDLLARKAVTRELGRGAIPPPINEFIRSTLAEAEGSFTNLAPASQEARQRADAFYLKWIERLDH